jgi:DNA (cytosine-5)-methyltransferase 1
MSLETLTLKELKKKCKTLNIKNYTNKDKSKLIELINNISNETNKNNDLKKIIETIHKLLKTNKFIDLFCGIGGFHQALTTFGLECLLACDIDKACRVVYKNNYGIDPVEDVKKINPETLEDFSILCGGFPCFVAGTKVLTEEGYKNIEDVTLDNKLMTHTGKFQNIINLQRTNYNGSLYKIQAKYHTSFTTTEKHPFYVREKTRRWNTETNKYDYTYNQPEWKRAQNLTKNDYFGMKINQNRIIPEFNFDDIGSIKLDDVDMWFMMGYHIGNGCLDDYMENKKTGKRRNRICFCINEKHIELVLNKCKKFVTFKFGYYSCKSGKASVYTVSNKLWFNILKLFGKYAHGKLIPEWVQDAPKEYIEHFIDGYRTADGCITKNERYSFTTVSYNLAFGLQRLYLKLGHLFSINKFIRPKTTVIEGRTVNQRDTYLVRGYVRETKRQYPSFIEDDYAWFAPFKMEKIELENEPVFNFEVENDNSYCVENIVASNCQSFSNGGKKKAFNDERGLLFDEIMRIAKVKQPEFMFLENVKHIRKVDNGKVFQYILDKLDKNNYYVQTFDISPHQFGIPQQRERVYFVCIHKSIYHNKKLELIIPKNKPIKLETFLEETPDPKYNVSGNILNVLNSWESMIKKFNVNEKISPTILVNEFYKSYTEEEFNMLPNWKKDYMKKNKPLYEKYKKDWDIWYKKNQDILNKREIYAKLEWQTGPIKKNDSIFNHFIQLRQSGIRVKKAYYFPTLVAISQIPIYGKQKRYITPRECARLQSFPDTFKIDSCDKNSYKQFGNCVNVDNVKTIVHMTFESFV